MIDKSVFISYAREDLTKAELLHDALCNFGIDVWFDRVCLKPGADWRREIIEGIRKTRYFLALLSSNSVNKKGYVQKELKIALEILDEYPSGEVFVVPIRLDDCSPTHHAIQNLNWLDLFPDWEAGVAKLVGSIDVPPLRYDGVYYVHPDEDSSDQIRIFRFFEDGSVFYDFFEKGERIMVPPRDHRSSKYTCTGKFTIKDGILNVTTTNIAGNVEFEGAIKENHLVLKWFSHVNSKHGADTYLFQQVDE